MAAHGAGQAQVQAELVRLSTLSAGAVGEGAACAVLVGTSDLSAAVLVPTPVIVSAPGLESISLLIAKAAVPPPVIPSTWGGSIGPAFLGEWRDKIWPPPPKPIPVPELVTIGAPPFVANSSLSAAARGSAWASVAVSGESRLRAMVLGAARAGGATLSSASTLHASATGLCGPPDDVLAVMAVAVLAA
jgi:hypothetical protein